MSEQRMEGKLCHMHVIFLVWKSLGSGCEPIDFIGQVNQVQETNRGLGMPFGMCLLRLAPFFTRIYIFTVLQYF